MHGTWISDQSSIATSDRRLKENIRPLVDAVRDAQDAQGAPSSSKWKPETESAGAVAQWLLRQLRPVSYNLKNGNRDKRFGFIADEMQQTLPQVVRKDLGEGSLKGIMYEDLIAVLTYSLQNLQSSISSLGPRLMSIEERIEKRKQWKRSRRTRAR
jgi:hypothetical protein